MNFIGRTEELGILESEYAKKGSLTIICGRRRVGKTTLINRFMQSKKGVYFLATQQNARENLLSFSAEVARASSVDGMSFASWESAMDYAVKTGAEVIAIDEFQYIADSDPSVISVFQHAWDTKLKDSGMMLILCGSHISAVEKHILDPSGPLFGRISRIIRLDPLDFSDILGSRKWPGIRPAIEYYGITGGVPRYMELIEPSGIRGAVS